MEWKKHVHSFLLMFMLWRQATTDPIPLDKLTVDLNIRERTNSGLNPETKSIPMADYKYFRPAYVTYGLQHRHYGSDYSDDAESGSAEDKVASAGRKSLADVMFRFLQLEKTVALHSKMLRQPQHCNTYKPLSDKWRNIKYTTRDARKAHCDAEGEFDYNTDLKTGWYRFTGDAGTKLPTSPAKGGPPETGEQICGTSSVPYILSGGNPTMEDGVVKRELCFEYGSESCRDKSTVRVAACKDKEGEYLVYKLHPVASCETTAAYCAID